MASFPGDPGVYGDPLFSFPGREEAFVHRANALALSDKEVMQLPKEKKVEFVRKLREDITSSKAFLLTDYRGLNVSEITALRRSLRDTGAEYRVVKNTLFQLAAEDLGESGLAGLLEGPTAVAFVHQDAIATAKALVGFMRVHKALSIKGGYMDGGLFDGEQIQALSKVPPREVLVSQLLGALQSPMAGLVGTLQGVVSEFVYTLQAVADKKAA